MTIATLAGRRHELRLTVKAFFAIPDIDDALIRLAGASFTFDDVVTAWRACHADGPLAGLAVFDGVRVRDMPVAAKWAAMAIYEGLRGDDAPADAASQASDDKPVTLGSVYQTGFAIGLKPREVDDLTPWQFAQCVAGFNLAHAEQKDEAPRRDELAELVGRYG